MFVPQVPRAELIGELRRRIGDQRESIDHLIAELRGMEARLDALQSRFGAVCGCTHGRFCSITVFGVTTATVTVMFTDLVDSTALMSRVGETAAEGLRREHFAVLRTAVDERGGREVKNLGDGLMVVFSSAADAVAAAVDIQRVLARRNRRAVEPLLVRVGIASGDADVDGDDYFGVPVVQASRLCGKATGGEVLCTDIVRALSGSRVDAVFEPIGELDLKGLSEPVATSRLSWTADTDEAVALPARLSIAVTDRFVGRSVERERITAAWKQATSEAQCRVVLVSGEPGIGKTTLTARLAAEVQAEGAVVVYGRCDEDLGIPYQPWIEALTQLVAAVSDEVVRHHVGDRGAHLARLVPSVARRAGVEVPSGDGGDSERFVLLGCVVDLLERASADTPLLIVVDDLHWTDRQTVQVLKHVTTSAVQAPVMIVGTFRDTDIADGDPMSELLAAFHRVGTVERITLRGLGDAELLELLEYTAGHTMDDAGIALRDAVLAETDGNPFFVNEVLRHLAETGAVYQNDDGRWVGDRDIRAVGLPVSVTEVVGRRVAALGTDTHRLLTLASVIGRDFDIATLAAAAGVDELDVIDRCDAAVSAAVLQPTAVVDRYTFTHALIERTLYDSMSPSRRARTHRMIAEAIEALHGEDTARAAELAHHWAQAVQPVDAAKALHYAQLAGDRALDQLAPDEALRWYENAVELSDKVDTPPRQRIELLIGLGTARRQTGDPEYRHTLLEVGRLADDIGADDLYVRSALAGFRGFQSTVGVVDHELVNVIIRALEHTGDADSPERVRLLTMAAAEQQYSTTLEQRLTLVEEAISVARRLGDPALLKWVLSYSCVPVRVPRTTSWRKANLEEARALGAEATDLRSLATLAGESAYVALDTGDINGFEQHIEEWRFAAERVHEPSHRWSAAFVSAVLPMIRGQLDVAEAAAEAAFALGSEAGQLDAFTVYAAQLAVIRYHQGRLHELIPAMQEALEATPELHSYRGAIALTHARAGDLDLARDLIDAEFRIGFELPEDESWLTTVVYWSMVAGIVHHRQAAGHLHPLLDPFRDRFVHSQIVVVPAAALAIGMLEHALGRYDDADSSFTQGDVMHQRLRSPMFIAEGRAHWAAMLANRNRPGDRERARELATGALTVATDGGYGYTAATARQVLDQLDS